MCDRKYWAIEQYQEAKAIVEKDYTEWKISAKLYNNIKTGLVLLHEHIDDNDHRSFQKSIYDILDMKEDCPNCLLPASADCQICNWTNINDFEINE